MKACPKEKCLCCEILPQTAEHASRKKFPHVRAELRSRDGGERGGWGGGWLAGGSQPSATGVRVGQSQSQGVGSGCSEGHNSGQVTPTSSGAIKDPHGDQCKSWPLTSTNSQRKSNFPSDLSPTWGQGSLMLVSLGCRQGKELSQRNIITWISRAASPSFQLPNIS